MKKILLITILLTNISIFAQDKELKQTINSFFEGFHAKDTIKMKQFCHDKMLIQSISEMKTTPVLSTEKTANFMKSIASIPADVKFQEKILSYKITIDGAMATVQTPYEFYWKGNLSNVGVNQFTLFLENNQWKIVHIIDTRRKKI